MPKHQLLRHVKAKSLSVKIPKNEPNTCPCRKLTL